MKDKKINIGLIGFGNIGSYFYQTLNQNRKKIFLQTGVIPNIKYISAKSIYKKRKIKLPKNKWFKNPLNLAKRKDVDIIVELIGGSDGISKKVVSTALRNKRHVITANKALLSKHGNELARLAEKHNVNLEYEAAVAGGVPIIRSIKEGLIGNKINKIYGILNGTTNYILSSMENKNKNFNEILDRAKQLGFAESNPLSDLNGNDSASKLKILSSLAFNIPISKNKILTEGIQNINLTDIFHSKNLGYKIKLLSISEVKNNKLMEKVHPCLILKNSYIAKIDGVLNAIVVDGSPVGRSVLQGEGAGPGPTSSALISDLCTILKGKINYPFGSSSQHRKKIKKFDLLNHKCSAYLRIEVKDLPGVLSSITNNFSVNKISIKNLIQKPDKKKKNASIIIITHQSIEKNFHKLLKQLSKNKFIQKKPTFIRIENV